VTTLLSRRNLLGFCACMPVLLGAGAAEAAPVVSRSLAFRNLHTEEIVRARFMYRGKLQPRGLKAIHWCLRDHRTNQAHAIDPELLVVLDHLQRRLRTAAPFHVISGYRSPQTNAMLADTTSGVAESSLHTKGQAIDIRIPGVPLMRLHKAAVDLKAGGVGLYRESNFVHVDTGRVRYW